MAESFGKKAETLPVSFLSGIKYEHLVAGMTGGVMSTLITHPFDLIKLRFAGMFMNHTYQRTACARLRCYIRTYGNEVGGSSHIFMCSLSPSVHDGKETRERPRYRGLLHATRTIVREDRFPGLYRVSLIPSPILIAV